MDRRAAFVVLCKLGCLALCSTPSVARTEDNQAKKIKTSKRLQQSLRGRWLLQCRTVNGHQMSEPEGVYLVVADDGMMRTYSPVGSSDGPGPSLVENVFYRVDVTSHPVTIATTGRPDGTEASEGILRLKNDSLTLCFAAKNKSRPTQFATGAGAGMGSVLMIYKRPQNH